MSMIGIFITVTSFIFLLGWMLSHYSENIGPSFCRLGKRIWMAGTFGRTDMAKFYPEDKAPRIFRIMGRLIMFIAVLTMLAEAVFQIGFILN